MTEHKTERKGMPLWGVVLLFAALLGLLTMLVFQLINVQNAVVAVGQPLPDFTLTFYDGYRYAGQPQVKLSDLKGKVVLVNVWASWCKPCEAESPHLQQAWEGYKAGDQVVFLGVDYVDTPKDAQVAMKKFGIDYPNGPDLGTRISDMLNRNMGVPETYVVDTNGVLQYYKIGPFQSADEVRAVIDPLLP
jgi:cytochrome c biogenesis protein CcmG/thiol:disulfide interchange protein DsbE